MSCYCYTTAATRSHSASCRTSARMPEPSMSSRTLLLIMFLSATPGDSRTGPSIVPLDGSARGIVNLGGGPSAKASDPAFERFQQIDLEWPDIQPTDPDDFPDDTPAMERYNWTVVSEAVKAIHAAGRMPVLKINSNYKPDWLYRKVPYVNFTWQAEQMDGRTAMYWHPAYVRLLSERINATAQYLATDPVGRSIPYMRQTWAAIGEEIL